jgi:hypothetical protein
MSEKKPNASASEQKPKVEVTVKPVLFAPNLTANPYREGSLKQLIFQWALERKEFSKSEFKEAVVALKDQYGHKSRMADDVLGNAWWNELVNKHKTISRL